MAIYRNHLVNAPLMSVEFTPVSDGNFAFFHVDTPLKKDAMKAWLTSPEVGQEIIAETHVGGHPVLVTHGDKTPDAVLKLLEANGNHFVLEKHKRRFDPWVTRAILGFAGQSMFLVSGLMKPKKRIDWGIATFAVCNLTANTIALTYGAQKSEDIHRLRFLKNRFNNDLEPHMTDGQSPSVESQAVKHEEQQGPRSIGENMHRFISRHSVQLSEVFLRYFGAFALAFPSEKWKAGKLQYRGDRTAKRDMQEMLGNIYGKTRASSNLTHAAGIGSMIGKTVALFSKAKDPYDPSPHSFLDTIREQYTFPAGGLIEAASFGALSYDHFINDTHKIHFRGKPRFDYLGGIGSAMFVAAYLMRTGWAKFAEKEVDMDELYAHVTNTLSQLPPEKLPQLMADTAASIKEHFKDKPVDFGEVFTRLMNDAYRYHHIALKNQLPVLQKTTDCPVQGERTLLHSNGKRQTPATSHVEQVARDKQAEVGHGLSA